MLYIPDYRSGERTFQLLTQVAGRAGRADKPGRVIVQTYTPEHPVIGFAARHDYPGFYQYEIAMRRAALFPPFALFLRIVLTGHDEAALAEDAARCAEGSASRSKMHSFKRAARRRSFCCWMQRPPR